MQFPFSGDGQVSRSLPSSLNLQVLYGCVFLVCIPKRSQELE